MLKKIFLTVAIVNFIMLNLAVGYLVYEKVTGTGVSEVSRVSVGEAEKVNEVNDVNNEFVCDENCQKVIEEKVADFIPIVTGPTLSPAPTKIPAQPKTKIVSYIPIPGAGSTASTTWTNLAGTEFSFSKGDYGGFKEAYFEANMKLFNGNGVAYLRLYDVSNSRAVDGSEISTSSQTSVAVSSGKISLWEGNNTYRIQARSLTADTTYFESGRIKIINEQ